jgi:hypothetical protein
VVEQLLEVSTMEILKTLGIAALGATVGTMLIIMVIVAPFVVWALFTSGDGSIELPNWLDRSLLRIAIVLWVILALVFLAAGLGGAFG